MGSNNPYWKNRGFPWEYDPGPPLDSEWPQLFAQTPNYRQISQTAMGKEKFRWHFGPMFYRGRLEPGAVKVLVIGQEGAQDESLSHRSFTGGTGAKMQYFLHHIGIDHSYLFLNTFVYPIFGQYDDSGIRWLGQNPASPIMQHRHRILDYVLQQNDLRLVIAVGTAAKETVETWVNSHGGQCPDRTRDLSTCSQALGQNVRIVGVLHPGGAAQGGSTTAIRNSFQTAADHVKTWLENDPDWLPADPTAKRNLNKKYTYSSAPIPFCDFPYGTNWRLGRGGTSSNRKDSQKSIQLFSADGAYNAQGVSLKYPALAASTAAGYSAADGEVAYEQASAHPLDYDPGPGTGFAQLLSGAADNLTWPDFNALGVTAHASFGCGPGYRGHPQQATALILADQESHDDLFTCRALTGDAGQRLQAYLESIGLTRSYCILRVLPVDTLDLSPASQLALMDNPDIQRLYAALVQNILAHQQTHLILSVGSMTAKLLDVMPASNLPVIKLKAWKESGAKQNWQQALTTLHNLDYPTDIPPSYSYDGGRSQIPAYDLPFGTLKWQASSGDKAQRAKTGDGKWSPDYYKFSLPDWVFKLKPLPLTQDEADALSHFNNN